MDRFNKEVWEMAKNFFDPNSKSGQITTLLFFSLLSYLILHFGKFKIELGIDFACIGLAIVATLLQPARSADRKEEWELIIMTFGVTGAIGILFGNMLGIITLPIKENSGLSPVYALSVGLSIAPLISYYARGDMSRRHEMETLALIESFTMPFCLKRVLIALSSEKHTILADKIISAINKKKNLKFFATSGLIEEVIETAKEIDSLECSEKSCLLDWLSFIEIIKQKPSPPRYLSNHNKYLDSATEYYEKLAAWEKKYIDTENPNKVSIKKTFNR